MGFGFSYWLSVIFLLLMGVVGISSILVKKKPGAKEFLDKLAKISGVVGLLAGAWGLYVLVSAIVSIDMIRFSFLGWIAYLATGIVFVGLGYLFGYGLIVSIMNEQAKAKAEGVRQKLAGFQILLGWVSLGLGAWWILVSITPRVLLF